MGIASDRESTTLPMKLCKTEKTRMVVQQVGLGVAQRFGIPLQCQRHAAAGLEFLVLRDIAVTYPPPV